MYLVYILMRQTVNSRKGKLLRKRIGAVRKILNLWQRFSFLQAATLVTEKPVRMEDEEMGETLDIQALITEVQSRICVKDPGDDTTENQACLEKSVYGSHFRHKYHQIVI